jgi:hypothetical protein
MSTPTETEEMPYVSIFPPHLPPNPTADDLHRFHVARTKQLRKGLDELLQHLHDSTGENLALEPAWPVRTSRERSLATTKLQEAIMWLGMDLKAQGNPNPYPQSYNPQSPTVAPTADGLKL